MRKNLTQQSLTYDAWNRAASVGGQPLVFDGLGRLALYASNNSYFYSDSWQFIEQRQGTSQFQPPVRQFVWGLRYIDDLVLRDSPSYTPNRLYALQDPNWNVTAIVDTTAIVKERYSYDGYGMPAFMNGSFSFINSGFSSNFDWETLFAGYRYGSSWSLYLVRNRWYSPFAGRWLTRDDLSAAADASLYLYCRASAINFSDPSGLKEGFEQMHWFMKYYWSGKGQRLVDAKCKCPTININNYTTEYTTEEHRWIHKSHGYEVSTNYQLMYENILDKSKTCCDFLKSMLAMMLAWDALVRMAREAGLIRPEGTIMILGHVVDKRAIADWIKERNEKQFDLIKYRTTVDPPVSQLPDYLAKLHLVCGSDKKKKERTLRDVKDRTEEIVQDVRNFEGMDKTDFDKICDVLYFSLRAPVPAAAVPAYSPVTVPALVH